MPQNSDGAAPPVGGPPDPPDRKKIAAAALLIGVLIILTIFLLPFAFAGFWGGLAGDHGIGRFFLLVLDSDIDPKILTGITAIVGVGSAFVAGGGLSNRLFYTIVGLSAFLILLSLLIWVLLSDGSVASKLYNYGSERIADAASFRTATRWVLGGTILWLLAVLGAQVGLRAAER